MKWMNHLQEYGICIYYMAQYGIAIVAISFVIVIGKVVSFGACLKWVLLIVKKFSFIYEIRHV